MMETEARGYNMHHSEQPPAGFQRKQLWVALALVGMLVLGVVAAILLR
jgi:uncharacterized protein involved in exopolysaccharide biosynthesis